MDLEPEPRENEFAEGSAPRCASSDGGDAPAKKIDSIRAKTPDEPRRERKACRPDQTPISKLCLEVVAVAVGIAYTVAAFQQLKTMKPSALGNETNTIVADAN